MNPLQQLGGGGGGAYKAYKSSDQHSSGVWSIEMSRHTHTNNYPHAFLIVQLNKVASQEEEGYTENTMLLSGLECCEAAHVRGLMGVICQIILTHRDGQDKVIQI